MARGLTSDHTTCLALGRPPTLTPGPSRGISPKNLSPGDASDSAAPTQSDPTPHLESRAWTRPPHPHYPPPQLTLGSLDLSLSSAA